MYLSGNTLKYRITNECIYEKLETTSNKNKVREVEMVWTFAEETRMCAITTRGFI